MQVDPKQTTDYHHIARALRTVRFDPAPAYIEARELSGGEESSDDMMLPARAPSPPQLVAGPSRPAERGRTQARTLERVPDGVRPVAMATPRGRPVAAAQAPSRAPVPPLAPPQRPLAPARPASPASSLHAPGFAAGVQPMRGLPVARRVAPNARTPMEPPTQAASTPYAPLIDGSRQVKHNPEPHRATHVGQMADMQTTALQPQEVMPLRVRTRGRLQAAIDALLPAKRRYKNDSQQLAAWLRDHGLIALDDSGQDRVLRYISPTSNRLERLGILQAFPNLDTGHVRRLQEELGERYTRQMATNEHMRPAEDNMTQVVREVLPKTKKNIWRPLDGFGNRAK